MHSINNYEKLIYESHVNINYINNIYTLIKYKISSNVNKNINLDSKDEFRMFIAATSCLKRIYLKFINENEFSVNKIKNVLKSSIT